jgi:hypothetical protein
MQGKLLFKVIASGHEYRIYTNGRVEGFGDDVKVFNNYLQLLTDHLRQAQDCQDLDARTPPHDSGALV